MIVSSFRRTAFVDLWILDSIFLETIFIFVVLIFFPFFIFTNNSVRSLFCSILFASLIILIPITKYNNYINIYNPYDPLAHYSFAKWIIIYGHIPVRDEVYYSEAYGHHPANGLIPVILYLVTGIPLDWAMNITLLVDYIVYVAMFYITLKILSIKPSSQNLQDYLMLIAAFSLMYFQYFYNALSVSYAFVALITYFILKKVFVKLYSSRDSVAFLLIFAGLLLLHYSTAIVISYFFVLLILVSFLISYLRRKIINLGYIVLTVLLTFLTYEIFVDIFLFHGTIYDAMSKLVTPYLFELEEAKRAIQDNPSLTFNDMLRFLIAREGRLLLILSITIIQLPIIIFILTRRKSYLNEDALMRAKVISILQYVALSTATVAYFGVGSLGGIVRNLHLLQFFVSLNIINIFTTNSLHGRKCENLSFAKLTNVFLIIAIIFNFVSSYGLYPIGPTLVYNGEVYRIAGGFGVLSPYPFKAILFVSAYSPPSATFVTLSPFITFGYSDLLWNINKLPKHGFVSPGVMPENAVKTIRLLLNTRSNLLIPITLTDKLYGRIGLKSYYTDILEVLSVNASMIYNSKCFGLFYN
jgi:hypothetical protein